jgi:hypothetical protein
MRFARPRGVEWQVEQLDANSCGADFPASKSSACADSEYRTPIAAAMPSTILAARPNANTGWSSFMNQVGLAFSSRDRAKIRPRHAVGAAPPSIPRPPDTLDASRSGLVAGQARSAYTPCPRSTSMDRSLSAMSAAGFIGLWRDARRPDGVCSLVLLKTSPAC